MLNGGKETKPIISKYYILNVYILSPTPPICVIIPNHSPPQPHVIVLGDGFLVGDLVIRMEYS